MRLERLVDAVDDWLEEHVHEGAERGAPPLRRRRAGLLRARDELRRATAGVLFLRNKLEAEQTERRVRLARACHAILRAAREDDDETALPLLAYRGLLRERIEAAEEELAGLRTQAADAKSALARVARQLGRLERAGRPARARGPLRGARGWSAEGDG